MLQTTRSLKILWESAAARLPGDVLVALDVDETLLRSPDFFGSEKWYDKRIRECEDEGLSESDAVWKANDEWELANQALWLVAVEEDTAARLAQWQTHSPAMGLTARTPRYAKRTFEQLAKVGMFFQGARGAKDTDLNRLGSYEAGTLYVGPEGDKGKSLAAFLERLPKLPDAVFFADDRPAHIESMQREMARMGVECRAWHFIVP